jgi:medium-chain acyl-[acyl-carrier-protein] hydrolase
VNKSIVCLKKRDNPTLRLFCFPYAGGTSQVYRSWINMIPSYCELFAIVLPGREGRYQESFLTSLADVLAEINLAISSLLDIPFIFFGHSMGALIAYELLKKIELKNSSTAEALAVSACKPPQDIFFKEKISHLSEEEFFNRLRAYGGTPNEILNDKELLQIILPRLRADIKILESYQFREGEKLNCPILGFCGKQDPYAPPDLFSRWDTCSQKKFIQEEYTGGHFYIQQFQHEVIKKIFSFTQGELLYV